MAAFRDSGNVQLSQNKEVLVPPTADLGTQAEKGMGMEGTNWARCLIIQFMGENWFMVGFEK